MDIINNPTDSNLLAVNINDNISFLHVSPGFSATETLMKNEEYSLENISMPDMALPIDMHTVKCMCWCSSSGCFTADSLALGFGSGKVLLWPHVQQNSCIASPTEFIPHGNRACTCLAWNSGQPNQIAIGMERSRAESSLLVWDIMSEYNTTGSSHSMDRGKQQNTETYSTTGTHRSTKRSNFSKPVFESCFSESVNSVLWAKHDPKLMILGTNGKHLKILDIRTIKPTNAMVNTKSVFGICQDPCFDMRLASFHENQVCVWDLRSFTKPAAIIPMRNNVIKVEWCPTRTGLLATAGCGLSEDGIIRLYDTTHAMVTDSDSEIAYRHIEQIVQPKLSPGETIGSFAWLKNDKNLLLTISSLKLLHRVTVHERIAVAWTSHCSLMSTCEEIYEYSRLHIDKLGSCNVEEVDIENIIYKRALNMYGFQEDLPQYDPNINLEPSNTRLHALWRWIEKTTDLSMVQSRAQVPQISSPTSVLHTRSNSGLIYSQLDMKFSDNNKFNGLLSYLGRQHASSKEEVAWLGVPDICCTTYESMCRVYALQMCGWYSIRKTREENANFKKMLLTCDSVERAAALAVWHLDMRTAIDILRENSEKMDASQDYPVIAMAFSGYSAETGKVSPLWQEVCETLQKSMPNPYLRAAFVFLNSNDNSQNNYKAILKSEALSISDRVGFACLYLPDDMLLEQLTILAESAVECGDLEGVTITGLTSDLGINLLQNYVDKTKDVQTAALALIKTKSVRILKNSKVAHMIDGYRSLLNTWMLWKERAVIDIAIGTIGAGLSINSSCQDLFIHCNYCRKSIQNNARETNLRGRGMLRPSPGMVSKSTSCPSCRKPLPRCSICSICLGTSTSLHHSPQPQLQQCKNNLDHWFTWCPICQHGGHTKHLRTWFQDHIKCPVSGCPCKCWQVKND